MSTLNPTPRPSKVETLEDLYNTVSSRQAGPQSAPTGIRSHLARVDPVKNNWGLSKFGGVALVNAINGTSWRFFNRGRDYHSVNFQKYGARFSQPTREYPVGFTEAAFDYARAAYNHDNTRYR